MTSNRRPHSRGSRLNATRNYVLDLETLGTGPDAVVVAAALVQFDAKSVTLVGRWTLDAEEQEKRGRKIDTDTVMWWLRQSAGARDAVAGDDALAKRVSVSAFLIELRDILTPRAGGDRDIDYTLWAKPSHFDIAVLEHLSRQFKPQWRAHLHRRKMHNVRTALAMVNLVRAGIDWPEDLDESPNPEAHVTIASAVVTAAAMRDVLKEIEGFTGLLNVVRESMEKQAGLSPVVPQVKVPRVLASVDEAPCGSLVQISDDAFVRFPNGSGWRVCGEWCGYPDGGWDWERWAGTDSATVICENLTEAECFYLCGLSTEDALAWCSARAATQEAAK